MNVHSYFIRKSQIGENPNARPLTEQTAGTCNRDEPQKHSKQGTTRVIEGRPVGD